ncbi:MAG: hypothetical protein IPN53_22880 [Comamonadaceae bacterium]|nr:hypothetical protein [Comamonadaceae bacterium]
MDVAKSHLKLGQKDKACRLFAEVIKNNHEDTQISSQIAAVLPMNTWLRWAGAGQAARQEVIDINNRGWYWPGRANFREV